MDNAPSLSEARTGFESVGVAGSLALVTLELCEKVLLPQGRTSELRGMVEESVPVLQGFGLSADALRAWRVLQVATRLDVTRLAAAAAAGAQEVKIEAGGPLPAGFLLPLPLHQRPSQYPIDD